jgi:hypothetical protein
MLQFHNVEQGEDSEEWNELRLGKVTASNFGKIMAFDGCPINAYVVKNIGTREHIDKSIDNYENKRKLGSIQQKTVDYILTNVCDYFYLDDISIHDKIYNYAKSLNIKTEFGETAKKYALQLALERITGKKSEFGFKSDDMQRGNNQEPIARMLYEEQTFSTVDNGGFFCDEEWGDSPDGLIGNDGIIEIKSVIPTTHYDTLLRKSFDPTYKWQLVGHLEATGRQWVDFVSYCSDFSESKQLLIYRSYKEDFASEIERLQARRLDFLELIKQTMEIIQ